VRENPTGTPNAPITWVFEPESFAPLAKLTATDRYGIVTDHLGTPTAMLDEQGQTTWSADIGVFGELRNVVGDKAACPFRWPGQYEDEETGLYYNRFRYYDPEAGGYVSQDPIGLIGGLRPHKYAHDPVVWLDPLGLTCKGKDDKDKPHALWSGEGSMQAAQQWAEKNGGVTLEMTARGDRAARHAKGLDDWEMSRPVWAKESRRYAKEASGEVHVFVTAAARTNPNSVLNSVELPTLARNPKVTNIVFHDVP
jgi:RHS repeat-associated protein